MGNRDMYRCIQEAEKDEVEEKEEMQRTEEELTSGGRCRYKSRGVASASEAHRYATGTQSGGRSRDSAGAHAVQRVRQKPPKAHCHQDIQSMRRAPTELLHAPRCVYPAKRKRRPGLWGPVSGARQPSRSARQPNRPARRPGSAGCRAQQVAQARSAERAWDFLTARLKAISSTPRAWGDPRRQPQGPSASPLLLLRKKNM